MELPIYSYVKFEAMNVNFSCNDKVVRKITWHKYFLSKFEHWTLEGKFIFWQFVPRKSSKQMVCECGLFPTERHTKQESWNLDENVNITCANYELSCHPILKSGEQFIQVIVKLKNVNLSSLLIIDYEDMISLLFSPIPCCLSPFLLTRQFLLKLVEKNIPKD